MKSTIKKLEKVEIIQEENGSVGSYVNGEKVDTTDTLGIHLDVRYELNGAYLELSTRNRVCILNYGE